MKTEKKQIPVGRSMFWGQTATGIFWLGAGVSGMFDTLILNVVSAFFLLTGIISMVAVLRMEYIGDDADEMADYNYLQAKAKAGSLLHVILCIASVASTYLLGMMQNADVNWPRIIAALFLVLMGVHNLLIGLIFSRLEAE